MTRYMIYMPVGTQGRLILCGRDGSLTLGEMETLVDGYIEVLDSRHYLYNSIYQITRLEAYP